MTTGGHFEQELRSLFHRNIHTGGNIVKNIRDLDDLSFHMGYNITYMTDPQSNQLIHMGDGYNILRMGYLRDISDIDYVMNKKSLPPRGYIEMENMQ